MHYPSSLKHDFSVIALSETWLTEDSRHIFKLPKYNSVHSVRENRSGGRVSLFINGDYEFKIRDDLSLKSDGLEVESVYKSDTLTGDVLNILYSSYFLPLIHKST